MFDDLMKLLSGEKDLSRYKQQISNQVESLERENESRIARYEKVKSKIDRLNSIKSLFVRIENPKSDEFNSGFSNDCLERMKRQDISKYVDISFLIYCQLVY